MAKLIKITTLKREYLASRVVYINPDAVTVVEMHEYNGEPYCVIHMGAGEHGDAYQISAEEWARIEPLLVDEVQAVLPVDVLEAWNAFDKASWDYMTSESAAVPARFDDTRAMFLTCFGDFVSEMRRAKAPITTPPAF